MATFHERLRQLRKERGITLERLAEILKTTKSTLSRYENGVREPTIKFIQQLADFFEVSTDYLLGRTDIRDINAINDRKFWEIYDKLKTRNDLLVLFEYTKDLSPKTIAQIVRIIKVLENTQNDEV